MDGESEDDDFDLHIPKYDRNNFEEINAQYISGKKLINVHATSLIFHVVVKTLKDIIEQMNTILNKDKLITFPHIRKFILSQLIFAQIEIALYGAFKAPVDDLFYQSPDSDDWQLMR